MRFYSGRHFMFTRLPMYHSNVATFTMSCVFLYMSYIRFWVPKLMCSVYSVSGEVFEELRTVIPRFSDCLFSLSWGPLGGPQ